MSPRWFSTLTDGVRDVGRRLALHRATRGVVSGESGRCLARRRAKHRARAAQVSPERIRLRYGGGSSTCPLSAVHCPNGTMHVGIVSRTRNAPIATQFATLKGLSPRRTEPKILHNFSKYGLVMRKGANNKVQIYGREEMFKYRKAVFPPLTGKTVFPLLRY